MSRDQRPGRTEFVDRDGRPTGAANVPATPEPAAAGAGPEAAVPPASEPVPVKTLAILFLIASGIGGGAVMFVVQALS